MSLPPDMDTLVACTNDLAKNFRLPSPTAHTMRLKLEEILFQRGCFQACQEGIITKSELRNLVLAHAITLIATSAGVPEPNWHDAEHLQVIRLVELALFGGTA